MRAFALCIAVVVCGCAGQLRKGDEFMMTVRSYNEDLRWRRLPSAATRIPPRERRAFLDEREALEEDLRIDDWEIKRIQWGSDRLRARVHVQYTWHSDRRGIVRTTTTVQQWEQHGKAWLMAAERHVRGHDMPGVARTKRDKKPLQPRQSNPTPKSSPPALP